MSAPTLDAVLLGGGTGTRFASGVAAQSGSLPKQFQMLGNAPVFVHCLKSLLSLGCFRQIVLAMPKSFIGLTEELMDSYVPTQAKTLVRVVAGGERRQDSSYLALEAVEQLSPTPTRVLIHDACRPYLSQDFLTRVRTYMVDRSYGAWVPTVPVVETLKKVENHQVIETLDRRVIFRVQTPQIFEFTVVRPLMEKMKENPELSFTDDASLCEYFGIPVGVFEGDVRNIKLTYDFELQTLRALLDQDKRPKDSSCEPELVTTFTA